MALKHEFGDFSFEYTPKNIEETFSLLYDNGTEVIYESKRVYEHREDDLNFDYHYLIETSDTDNGILCSVYLVLHKASLNERVLKGVVDFCGVEKVEVNSQDINDYGCSVFLSSQMCDADSMELTLDCAASIIDSIEALFGFYLDKHINYTDTGWSWIRKFI